MAKLLRDLTEDEREMMADFAAMDPFESVQVDHGNGVVTWATAGGIVDAIGMRPYVEAMLARELDKVGVE